jgi:predicted RNA-binding Zn ribbon-like protein
VDFAAYAQDAVALANAELDDLAALRSHLAARPWYAERVTARDLATLRRLGDDLRGVVAAADDSDAETAVARLNDLLARTPVSPRISGHDAQSWHLHVTAPGASPADDLAAEALMGLAVVVIDHGVDRLGRCEAAGCGRAYLDLSPNRSRRYCSDRCANRAGVAAWRARRRAAADDAGAARRWDTGTPEPEGHT